MESEDNEKLAGPEAIAEAFRNIAGRAREYFQEAAEALSEVPAEDRFRMPREADFFWSKLPVALQDKSTSVVETLVRLLPVVVPLAQRSPALTEADQRDIGFAVKGMRAALRLRQYRHWDIEVLHDECTVLGVQPPGQSEDHPLHPERAEKVFAGRSARLSDILELLTPGPSIPGPALPPPPGAPQAYKPGTAFIMMWMDRGVPELDDVADTVKRCFESFGITAVRSDDIQHEDLITKRILDEIKNAEFLFADLTGERPSVYYEVGFAHAIGRRVILFRKRGAQIHFDLAAYNCPEYDNLRDLEAQLRKRLQYVTGEKPRAGERDR